MLDIFIINSGSSARNIDKTKNSFGFKGENFYLVDSIEEINPIDKTNDWYFVIYDNEWLGEDLLDSLVVYIQEGQEKFYTMYRMVFGAEEPRISVAPRMFRKNIKLLNNSLCPDCGFPVDRSNHVLDGFIFGAE